MKSIKLKGILLFLVIAILSSTLLGCGKNTKDNSSGNNNGKSGTITALGSSALQPLVEQSAVNYLSKNSKAKINVQGGGSGAGINQVAAGNVEIGNSDVEAEHKIKDKTLLKDLVDHKVCGIGFVMVTSKDVTVKSLTKEQIQKIFSGEITNWKDVGGEDKEINVINRGKSSGTRGTFKQNILDGKSEKEGLGITQDSSGNVRTAMKQTQGSISYLALAYITKSVKKDLNVLKINDVEGNNENIINKKYPFWSYEHMYTKGQPKGLTKAFLDYMVSNENSELIKSLGYIPINELNE